MVTGVGLFQLNQKKIFLVYRDRSFPKQILKPRSALAPIWPPVAIFENCFRRQIRPIIKQIQMSSGN